MDYSQYKKLEFRRKFLKLFGAEITIFDSTSDHVVGFIKMKAWKLKEDIRVFRDNQQQVELIGIHARSIIDFGATYDIVDSPSGTTLCNIRRKGLRSTFVRDHWMIQSATDQPYGEVEETSGSLALVRRWFGVIPYIGEIVSLLLAFVPQTYSIYYSATGTRQLAGSVIHRKNPFVVKMQLDTSQAEVAIDARINVAVVSLLCVIDAVKG